MRKLTRRALLALVTAGPIVGLALGKRAEAGFETCFETPPPTVTKLDADLVLAGEPLKLRPFDPGQWTKKVYATDSWQAVKLPEPHRVMGIYDWHSFATGNLGLEWYPLGLDGKTTLMNVTPEIERAAVDAWNRKGAVYAAVIAGRVAAVQTFAPQPTREQIEAMTFAWNADGCGFCEVQVIS